MALSNSKYKLTANSTKHRTCLGTNQLYQLLKNFPVFIVTEGSIPFPRECGTGIFSTSDESRPHDTNSEVYASHFVERLFLSDDICGLKTTAHLFCSNMKPAFPK